MRDFHRDALVCGCNATVGARGNLVPEPVGLVVLVPIIAVKFLTITPVFVMTVIVFVILLEKVVYGVLLSFEGVSRTSEGKSWWWVT